MKVSHIKFLNCWWIVQSIIRTYILDERKTIAHHIPSDLTCRCRPGCSEASQKTLPYGGPYVAFLQGSEKGNSHSLSKFKVTSVGGKIQLLREKWGLLREKWGGQKREKKGERGRQEGMRKDKSKWIVALKIWAQISVHNEVLELVGSSPEQTVGISSQLCAQ